MRTRTLGKSGLELTTIGLGTWAMGGTWQYGWGPQDDEDSVKTIWAAFDAGINWLDTAPIYGCGHSETVVGKALSRMKQKPIVATKCGLLWNEKCERVMCLDFDSIIRECEDSLRRLGIETIDFYQLHWPEPDEQLEEAWSAMARLVEDGKVRYLGASNVTVEQLKRLQKIYPVAGIQPPYSMLKRDIEKDLLPFCKEQSIGIVCYSPMQKGLLTGKFTKQYIQSLAPDDHRRQDPNFLGAKFERNLRIVEELKPIAQRSGKTVAQLAIVWTLRKEEVTSAIVGARRPEQIKETVGAGDWEIGKEDIIEIDTILKQ